MDGVFRALADPTRRALLDRLHERNGQTLTELCASAGMTRQSVTQHLGVLEDANLVSTTRRGREKLHYLNPVPLHEIQDRWIEKFERPRLRALSELRRRAEDTMPDPTFVYVTYIEAGPEQVWQALTDPAFTTRYWNLSFDTTWEKGAPMVWDHGDAQITDPGQVVLEADPYTRLSYTWHSFTPEWAQQYEIDDERLRGLAAEPRSKVVFELEPDGDQVRLTVIHDGFDEGSEILDMISGGWPKVISALKTFLETDDGGRGLPA